jgi:hypothetical protein
MQVRCGWVRSALSDEDTQKDGDNPRRASRNLYLVSRAASVGGSARATQQHSIPNDSDESDQGEGDPEPNRQTINA